MFEDAGKCRPLIVLAPGPRRNRTFRRCPHPGWNDRRPTPAPRRRPRSPVSLKFRMAEKTGDVGCAGGIAEAHDLVAAAAEQVDVLVNPRGCRGDIPGARGPRGSRRRPAGTHTSCARRPFRSARQSTSPDPAAGRRHLARRLRRQSFRRPRTTAPDAAGPLPGSAVATSSTLRSTPLAVFDQAPRERDARARPRRIRLVRQAWHSRAGCWRRRVKHRSYRRPARPSPPAPRRRASRARHRQAGHP